MAFAERDVTRVFTQATFLLQAATTSRLTFNMECVDNDDGLDFPNRGRLFTFHNVHVKCLRICMLKS